MRAIIVVLAGAGCGRIHFDGRRIGDGAGNGDAVMSASCSGLPATCGAGSNESCCATLVVTGGTFYRSYDRAVDGAHADNTNPATVSDFRLDKHELTVGRFRSFVEAGMGTQAAPPAAGGGAHPALANSGWDTSWNAILATDTPALRAAISCAVYPAWTDAPGANENRPMNCIDWYEAMAFCVWDGGFLPTEAEWNYAAAGGDEQRAYPWSSPPTSLAVDETHASYYVDATRECFGDMMNGCAVTDLVVVGSRPAGDGKWGHSELGGNVFEWTLDWHAPYVNPCLDCASLTPASDRIARGGGFYYGPGFMRAGYRNYGRPTYRDGDLGARCARTP